MPGPAPKLPRLDAAAPPPHPQVAKEHPKSPYLFGKPWWVLPIEGALIGAGAYFIVKIIRHYDGNPNPTSET